MNILWLVNINIIIDHIDGKSEEWGNALRIGFKNMIGNTSFRSISFTHSVLNGYSDIIGEMIDTYQLASLNIRNHS